MELEKELIELHKIKQHWNKQIPKAVDDFFDKNYKEYKENTEKTDKQFFDNLFLTFEAQVNKQVDIYKQDTKDFLNQEMLDGLVRAMESREE